MRKLLATLGVVGLLSSTVGTTMAFSPSTKINENKIAKERETNDIQTLSSTKTWDWSNINIDHSVKTAKTGTSNREDTASSMTISTESWDDFFMKANYLTAIGIFDLHTHKKDVSITSASLELQRGSSNNGTRVWRFENQNDQHSGWGHQTAYISLTVTASRYNNNEVSIEVVSYIHARTAGSSSYCSTESQLNSIKFIGEI